VLLLPRFVTTSAAAVLALLTGTVLAWALTASLIGPLPAGPLLLGTLYGALYHVFAVSVVAAVAGFTRSQATTVLASLGALLAFPLLAIIPVLRPWLPSELLAAVVPIVQGAPAADFLRSAIVTVAAIAVLLGLAVRRFGSREL
jgi:hypothetical protein